MGGGYLSLCNEVKRERYPPTPKETFAVTLRKTFATVADASNSLRSQNFVLKGKVWTSTKSKARARINAVRVYGTKSRIIVVNFTL